MIRLAQTTDAASIATIYAPYVLESHASFELEAPSPETMLERMASSPLLPWLVYEEAGRVIAYAYASQYHQRSAYAWNASVSIYVADDQRRRGLGRKLLITLCDLLHRQGYRYARATISLPNNASVALHESLGFVVLCIIPEAGYKNGSWHHVGWWRLALCPTPADNNPPKPQPYASCWSAETSLTSTPIIAS